MDDNIDKSQTTKNEFALEYVPDKYKTKELCDLAIAQDAKASKYIPDSLKTQYQLPSSKSSSSSSD